LIFFFLIKGKAGEVFRVDKRENTVIWVILWSNTLVCYTDIRGHKPRKYMMLLLQMLGSIIPNIRHLG